MTDDEMIYDALNYYSMKRDNFAFAISQKSYRKADGSAPSDDDVNIAFKVAEQANELLSKYYLKTKESK